MTRRTCQRAGYRRPTRCHRAGDVRVASASWGLLSFLQARLFRFSTSFLAEMETIALPPETDNGKVPHALCSQMRQGRLTVQSNLPGLYCPSAMRPTVEQSPSFLG